MENRGRLGGSSFLGRLKVSMIVLTVLASFPFAAGAAYAQKLMVGYGSLGGNQAIIAVVKDAGISKKYGFDVELVLMPGTKTPMALLAGDISFGITAATHVVNSRVAGADLVMVAAQNSIIFQALVAPKNITSPAQLKGKKLAIGTFGDEAEYAIQVALSRFGLNPAKDVAFVQIGAQAARMAAIESGNVHGTVVTPPNNLIARKRGLNVLLDLSELKIPYQSGALVTREQTIKGDRELVRRFVKAFVEGVHFYKTRREETIQSIAKFMRTRDLEAVEESYNFYEKIMPKVPYPSREGFQAVMNRMAKRNPNVANLKIDEMIDGSFVRELEEGGFIAGLYR